MRSHFGPVLEDLVGVLLRVSADQRPSAETLLCVPVLQSHVNRYVETALGRAVNHPLTAASALSGKPRSIRSCSEPRLKPSTPKVPARDAAPKHVSNNLRI